MRRSVPFLHICPTWFFALLFMIAQTHSPVSASAQPNALPLSPIDTVLESNTVLFLWTTGPLDSTYFFELRGDSLLALMTSDTSTTLALEIGSYEWRVRDSANEDASAWSEWAPFSIRDPLPIPVPISPDGDSLTADEITFLWSTGWEGENEWMISGESTWSITTSDSSLVATVDSGTYFWKVRSIEDGVGGGWSDSLSFVVLPVADLPVVSPLAPLNKTVGTGVIRLIWTADWRDEFEIQMRGDTTFTVSVSAFQYEVLLDEEGIYEWRIRARDGVQRGPWSTWWRITTSADIVSVEETLAPVEKLDIE